MGRKIVDDKLDGRRCRLGLLLLILVPAVMLFIIKTGQPEKYLSMIESSQQRGNYKSWSNTVRRILNTPVDIATLCDETDGETCLISSSQVVCGYFIGNNLTISTTGTLSCSSGILSLQFAGNLVNEGTISTVALQSNEIKVSGSITNEVSLCRYKKIIIISILICF